MIPTIGLSIAISPFKRKKDMRFTAEHHRPLIFKTPEIKTSGVTVEAQTGFEPVRTGVADHCLTAWLLRHTPRVGLEPTTLRLTAECSAIELSRII